MKTIKHIAFVLLLALAVLAAGCGGGEANNAGDMAGEAPHGGSGQDQSSTIPQQRIIIMEGTMSVRADDPTALLDYITNLAEWYEGYVTSSSLENNYNDDETTTSSGHVSFRVPAERLNDVIADIEAQEVEILSKNITGEDVTSDYVDLQSRLRNLENAAIKLEEIMDSSNNTEAVLEVYRELSAVNEEAEIVRGQIQYYEEAAAMSSLTVNIYQVPPEEAPWNLSPTLQQSTQRLKRSFQNWLEGITNFFIFFLPMFILRVGPWLVVFFFGGRWIYRKWKGIGKANNTPDISKLDE
jgi:hypothetical protein